MVQLYKTESIGGYTYKKNQVAWQTLEAIQKVGQIPAIGLEFLYLFGWIVMGGLKKSKIFEKCIQAAPSISPYLAMMVLYEKKKIGTNY